MMFRASRRPDRPTYRNTIFSLVAVMLVACAPPPLHRPGDRVAPIICSTVDTAAPTPPPLAVAYTRGTHGEGMIVPPPGRPIRDVAIASGGGATLSIAVPDSPLLVGGAIRAEFIARNDSSDPLVFRRPSIYVEDDAGQELTLHGFLPGNGLGTGGPPTEDPLILPGQSLDLLFNVQLPNADDLKGHAYRLVAQTRVLSPSHPDPANSGTPLQVTSSLALVQPTASQLLHAELYRNKDGWCLQVLAGDGSRPTSPLTVEIWAQTTRVANGGLLSSGDRGVWVGTWPEDLRGGGTIHVLIWVAGTDYVTARLDRTVSGH